MSQVGIVLACHPMDVLIMTVALQRHIRTVAAPLVRATAETLKGFGTLVEDPEVAEVEVVTWPVQGRRPIDPGTGNQGGTTEGNFDFWWEGDVLHGWNQAVDDRYVLGWMREPTDASEDRVAANGDRVLIRHANYHPDGGQLFYPLERVPFVAPLALPGDDVCLEDFVAFYFDGSLGLYIHPGVWHEAMLPVGERARFLDKQGKVHARISCDFCEEFGGYLSVPLHRPASITSFEARTGGWKDVSTTGDQ